MWTTLYNKFHVEEKKSNGPQRSGSAAVNYKSSWVYDMMTFLRSRHKDSTEIFDSMEYSSYKNPSSSQVPSWDERAIKNKKNKDKIDCQIEILAKSAVKMAEALSSPSLNTSSSEKDNASQPSITINTNSNINYQRLQNICFEFGSLSEIEQKNGYFEIMDIFKKFNQ